MQDGCGASPLTLVVVLTTQPNEGSHFHHSRKAKPGRHGTHPIQAAFMWEGDQPSLDAFVQKLDSNTKNIQLSWNFSKEKIVFLDLEIWKDSEGFRLCNYLKPTDRNSYIPLGSCHHKSWLCNIPRGQFVRLRRNCTRDSDFIAQSTLLTSRFVEKGYDAHTLKSEVEKVLAMDRTVLISDKVKNTSSSVSNFNYNVQHKQFEK